MHCAAVRGVVVGEGDIGSDDVVRSEEATSTEAVAGDEREFD